MGNPFGDQIYGQDSGQSSLDNGQLDGQYGGQAQGTGINPNFQPLLSDIPQDLHSKVLPHLQQWDKGVQDRFEKLQSGYAPWKPILSSGATPDMVQNGLNLVNLLETNPEGLYRALVEHYKFGQEQEPAGAGQGQTPPNQQAPAQVPDPYDLRIQQMEQNFTTVAEHVLAMRRQEEEARQDAMIAAEFKSAHDKLGNFDDQWVRAHCIADPSLSVEQAARNYQSWYNAEMAKHGARPIITGSSGGGVPGQNVDVTKLSGAQTRTLAADMIRQAKAAARQ
jgi:hypothetical protein